MKKISIDPLRFEKGKLRIRFLSIDLGRDVEEEAEVLNVGRSPSTHGGVFTERRSLIE